jgi:hypothetical protein
MFKPVALQCHSLHIASPSAVYRSNSALKSGKLSKRADQFLRTCSLPPPGWGERAARCDSLHRCTPGVLGGRVG